MGQIWCKKEKIAKKKSILDTLVDTIWDRIYLKLKSGDLNGTFYYDQLLMILNNKDQQPIVDSIIKSFNEKYLKNENLYLKEFTYFNGCITYVVVMESNGVDPPLYAKL